MTDLHNLVTAIAASGNDSPFRLRQGTIVSVAANDTATVTIGGSTTQIAGVKVASSVCPVPGASCWIATDGRDLFVIATLAPAGPAFAKMRKSTTQSIPTAAFTELNWASRTDTASVGMTLGSAGLTVVVPGIYSVTGNITFAANSTGNRHSQLVVNGTAVFQGTSSINLPTQLVRLRADGVIACNIGDVINISGYQNSGAGLATDVSSGACALSAAWLGPI